MFDPRPTKRPVGRPGLRAFVSEFPAILAPRKLHSGLTPAEQGRRDLMPPCVRWGRSAAVP